MEESRSTDYFRENKKKEWQRIKIVLIIVSKNVIQFLKNLRSPKLQVESRGGDDYFLLLLGK